MTSKKILFACLHKAGRVPSQRFRFEQYVDFLSQHGFDVHYIYFLDAKNAKNYYAKGRVIQKALILFGAVLKLFKVAFFRRYDIVFVQREAFMLGSTFFERQFLWPL